MNPFYHSTIESIEKVQKSCQELMVRAEQLYKEGTEDSLALCAEISVAVSKIMSEQTKMLKELQEMIAEPVCEENGYGALAE